MAHGPILVWFLFFVNTAVLQHAYNHSFKQSMEYFRDTKIELSSCSRDCVAHKACNIYYTAFIEHILWPPLYTSAVWNASLWIVSYKCMMKGRAGTRMQTKSLFPLSSNSCYEKKHYQLIWTVCMVNWYIFYWNLLFTFSPKTYSLVQESHFESVKMY